MTTPALSPSYVNIFRPIIHFIIILVVFWGAYILRQHTDLLPRIHMSIPPIDGRELSIFAVFSALIFVGFGFIKKLYSIRSDISETDIFIKTRFYRLISTTFVAYFGRGFIFMGGISRLIIIRSAIVIVLIIPIIDRLLSKISHKNQKILLIGSNTESLDHIKDKLQSKDTKKIIDFHTTLDTQISNMQAYDKIIFIGQLPKTYIENIFDTMRGQGIACYHIADSFFLEDIIYQPVSLNTIIAFRYQESKLDEWSEIVKRNLDLCVAILTVIVISPLLILIAIGIKISSQGPVFYLQQRIGKGGKIFTFIKFRTMYIDDCVGDSYGGEQARNKRQKLIQSKQNKRKGVLQKIANDPRVTGFGNFLRKTSLDELPNLFSVIQGTMSIVGPRPHMEHEVAQYKPRQKRLLSIKPGITGYAQIFGRDSLHFDEEASYDLYYIQNRSLVLDIYIILMTFRVILKGK